jgi:hypothetical protein
MKNSNDTIWDQTSDRPICSTVHCLYVVIFIIMLMTWLGPYAGPSSGHKIYKEENLYNVSHKI